MSPGPVRIIGVGPGGLAGQTTFAPIRPAWIARPRRPGAGSTRSHETEN